MVAPGYLRIPHVGGDLVTFAAADDVWLAPVGRGRAWRFTADEASPMTPRFSADGKQLAWVCSKDGGAEVYQASLADGVPTRLTYWGSEWARPVAPDLVRQLVWDMDGTLLDSSVVVPAAYVAAIARLGGPELTPAQVVASYSLGPPEALLAHLLGRELAAAESDVYYDELSAVTVQAYAGVEDVLAALRARSHRVAVFTGASTRAATMLLAAAGIAVDVLVGGDEVARPKPAADGLLLMARRLGIAPADLAYIGDAPNDLRAATAAGGIGAAAAWGHQYQSAEPAHVTLAAPAEALTLL